MPNTAEYKDYLFVKVPEDAITFRHGIYAVHCYNSSDESPENDKSVFIGVQYSDWQIIGKGDQIDWEGIVDVDEQFRERTMYKMYGVVYDEPEHARILATTDIKKAAASLLRSLEMEPGTTLVLKKI